MKLRESVNEINDPGQDKGRVKRENVGGPKKATPPPSQFQHLADLPMIFNKNHPLSDFF